MLSSFWQNKIFVILVIIAVCFLPSSIALPAQTEVRCVVIGVGIDKINQSESEYELSAQIVIPHYNLGYQENAQVISAVGKNLNQAYEKLASHIGKILGLSHCSTIVIGSGMKDENIGKHLDWFYRSKRLDNNPVLVYTNNSAKEILQTSLKVDDNLSLSLNSILQYNTILTTTQSSQLIQFLEKYYEKRGAEIVPIVDVVNKDYLGIDASKQGVSSSQSGSEGQLNSGEQSSSNKESGGQVLSNEGNAAVFNKGRFVTTLTSEELKGINNFIGESERGVITIENVTDDRIKNATVSLSKRGLIHNYRLEFTKNGKPRIIYSLIYTLRVEHILQENPSLKILQGYEDYISPEVKKQVEENIKSYCGQAVNIMKQNNIDPINIYKKFDAFQHTKWKEYLSKLENPEEYIKEVEFLVNVKIRGLE